MMHDLHLPPHIIHILPRPAQSTHPHAATSAGMHLQVPKLLGQVLSDQVRNQCKGDLRNPQELALADGFASELLAGLFVGGQACGAELAPAQHLSKCEEAIDILSITQRAVCCPYQSLAHAGSCARLPLGTSAGQAVSGTHVCLLSQHALRQSVSGGASGANNVCRCDLHPMAKKNTLPFGYLWLDRRI